MKQINILNPENRNGTVLLEKFLHETDSKIKKKVVKYFWSRQGFLNSDPKILKKKLTNNLCHKNSFTSHRMVIFMNNILEFINSNQRVNLDQSETISIENFYIFIYNECVDLHQREIAEKFGNIQFMNIPDMYQNLSAIKENAFQLFFLLKN